MKLIFIRHGKTAGNCEKRYIGVTDEPLCEEGRAFLQTKHVPPAEVVIVSPMRRCLETAELLYPRQKPVICDGLRECDFGDFEGKNYLELSGDPDYQRWIDSGGTLPFPGGERPEDFKRRCIDAFEAAMRAYASAESLAFVVHGGTVMTVLEKYALPKKNYYDFHVENGCGYAADFDGKAILITKEL